MYSTKLLHKGMVDGNAYITIGDPFVEAKANPFRQGKKSEKAPFQCKQIPVNEENGYFSKTVYKAGGYLEGTRYKDSQPLDQRKRGFGTKDAKRRDEFSNAIRTEQYRETIRKESELLSKGSEALQDELNRIMAERGSSTVKTAPSFDKTLSSDSAEFSYESQVPQYDIGRTRITSFNPKTIKDNFYQFNTNRSKRFGSFRPSSCDVGDSAWDIVYKPPANGGKSETKNFFDKSHLSVGAF